MDWDTVELVAQLATRAGMIMEDVVDKALLLAQADELERKRRLAELRRASEHMGILLGAAIVLEERGSDALVE